MFHCTIDNDYLVLLDAEARAAYLAATGSTSNALLYNMGDLDGKSKRAKRNFNVIIDYLKQERMKDPELFRRKYVFRSSWGLESVYVLFALMDGYRRLIPFFDMPEIDDYDGYASNPILSTDYLIPEAVNVLFLSKFGILSDKQRVVGRYSIPTPQLQHVFGTTTEFIIMTRFQKLKFTPDGVEIDCRVRSLELEQA